MFGYVCGGRPVETNITQVEPTKFVFTISDAAKINHLAVFLLPGVTLPPDVAAAVYCRLPGKQEFGLLGALSTSKQSAIYKLNTEVLTAEHATDMDAAMMDDDDTAAATAASTVEVAVGISIEPLAQVEQNLAQLRLAQQANKPRKLLSDQATPAPAPSDPTDIATLGNKIVAHAYNYMSSFVNSQGLVPIKAFDDWWNKFKLRLAANPAFLNTVE